MQTKVAIVIGSSGLVGRALTTQLIDSPEFEKIHLFVRRKSDFEHTKIIENIVDFDDINHWKSAIKGDVLFCAFGTTLKKAGSKENQFTIDYTYQYEFAKAAAESGVKHLLLVSSAGANEKSMIFYSQIKGKLDSDVKNIGFEKVTIFRPSILDGNRQEVRMAEKISLTISRKLLPVIPFIRKYRPIHADIVAKAMINASITEQKQYSIYTLEEIFELAKKK